jgi:hypothetical protein
MNRIDQRAVAGFLQERKNRLPGGLRLGPGVVAHRDAADTHLPEKEGGGVELRDHAGGSADTTDLPAGSQRFDHLGQQRAAHIVDGQIDTALFQLRLQLFWPVGIGGIQGDLRAHFL